MGWGTTDSFPESGFAGSWLYEALLLVAAYTFAAGRCTLWAPLRRLLCWVLERAGVFAGCHALAPQPRSSRPVVALLLEDVPAAVTGRALLEVLRKHGAKATMACQAQAVYAADAMGAGDGHQAFGQHLLRQAVSQGHELSIQARVSTRGSSMDQLNQLSFDIAETRRVLAGCRMDECKQQLAPTLPFVKYRKWLRLRTHNGVLKPALTDLAGSLGFKVLVPSVVPPPVPGLRADDIAAHMAAAAHPGAILGLPCGSLAAVDVLDRLLGLLREKRYAVTHMSELYCLSGRDISYNEAVALTEAELKRGVVTPPPVPVDEEDDEQSIEEEETSSNDGEEDGLSGLIRVLRPEPAAVGKAHYELPAIGRHSLSLRRSSVEDVFATDASTPASLPRSSTYASSVHSSELHRRLWQDVQASGLQADGIVWLRAHAHAP